MATIRRFFNPQHLRYEFETVPEVIPAAPETIVAEDVHLLFMHFNASTEGSVTVTDGQGTPQPITPANLPIGANVEYLEDFANGRLCPGGIIWNSSDGVSIVGYARWF